MEYTMQDRAQLIIEGCVKITSADHVKIFREIANKDYVRIHGPEPLAVCGTYGGSAVCK